MARRFLFTVRREPEAKLEYLEVIAKDSYGAIGELPDDVTDWDYAQFADGRYSIPVDEKAAA